MAQHDYVIANGTGAAVRSDLNNALAAIVSQNSGATEPATMYAYQWWADTSTGLLKLRNAANNAWITLRELDGTLTIEAGTVSAPGLAFASDLNTGIYSPSADQLGITTGGTVRLTTTTTGITSALPVDVPLGTASAPTVTFTGDLNTGIYSPGADQVAITTNGVERVEWGTSEVVFNDGGANYDFRIEGDTNSSLFFVDASAEAVGIGTTAPESLLHINGDATALRITRGSSIGFLYSAGTSTTSTFRVQANDGPLDLYSGSSQPITFSAATSEKARIDSSGRLLVGTSTARSNVYFGATATTPFQQIETATQSYDNGLSIINNSSSGYGALLRIGLSLGNSIGSNTLVSNGNILGGISFVAADGTNLREGALIYANTDEATSSGDVPTRLIFATTADGASSPTERMRITQAGTLLVGKTTTANGTAGSYLEAGGFAAHTVSAATVGYFNRLSSDGTIIDFSQDTISEGTIAVSGNTVSYNQFLGSHWAALTDWSRPEIKIGTILETINELTDWKYAVIEVEGEQKKMCYNGTAEIGSTVTVEYEGEEYEGIVELETDPEFNKAVKVKVNDTAASKAVYGVFVGWNNDSSADGGTWNDMFVGAVGNYVIRMAAGQEPEIGDLVEADGTGCAVVQDDDIIRTKTVAKITSTIPQVTYDDGSFLVTCVLYCG